MNASGVVKVAPGAGIYGAVRLTGGCSTPAPRAVGEMKGA